MINTAFFKLLLVACLISTSSAIARGIQVSDIVPASVSLETSALLLSPYYSDLTQSLTRQAVQNGKTLKIEDFSVVDLSSGNVYVYARLMQKFSAEVNGPWSDYGDIVGHVQYGPLGEVTIDSVYFKPAAEGPGGATVGN